MPRLPVVLAVVLAASSAASCGLIDSDVTDFNLKLPEKAFKVDTADWKLSVQGEMPAIACPPADCAAAADQFCSMGTCTSDCDPNGSCQAHVVVSVFQQFDLAHESPELAEISSKPIATVTVEAIAFRIDENTLNVASPPLTLYLAPQGITDPNSGEAAEIGTLEPVAPMITGEVGIVLTDTGKQTMAEFMKDYKTPFTVIVAGNVAIQAGDPVPTGRLSGVVTVTAHAGL